MAMDRAKGSEKISVGAQIPAQEDAHYRAVWKIEKYKGDFKSGGEAEEARKRILEETGEDIKFEEFEIEGNCLLNDGINNIIWPAVAGGSYTPINAADGCIGVGDSNTAAAATQTGLQAGTNHLWVLVSSAPTTGSNQQIVISGSFGSTQANWTWNEICAGTTNTPGSLPYNGATPPATEHVLNRLVSSMGTKASGTTWVATLTITLS